MSSTKSQQGLALDFEDVPNVQELMALAVKGLVPMFDGPSQLFCHRLVRTEGNLVREGLSHRYTIMTLLGLRKFEQNCAQTPFDTTSIYRAFCEDFDWIDGIGDLGLVIWLTAEFDPGGLDRLMQKFPLRTAFTKFRDARAHSTTELAWFLAGLAHAGQTSKNGAESLTDLAIQVFQRLKENQGRSGFFGHLARGKSAAGHLRGRIGSFADQVYPIYAMAKLSSILSLSEPLECAERCALAICSAQGSLGQWWWLYDSATGRVLSHYPVYSVHQHGMAPMALFALEQSGGRDFSTNIFKGLSWIYGSNELAVDLRDQANGLVWRCVQPQARYAKHWHIVRNLVKAANNDSRVGPLRILYEDRPYELGWLLFSFAGFDAETRVHSTQSMSKLRGAI
jgi:hypothetical protein